MKKQREGGFLIAKIHQLAGRILGRKLRQYGIAINPAQGRIMFVLWHSDGIPINELAKKTSLGKSTLTSMLDRLESSGHVARVPCAEDRRIILVQRTEKDKAFEKLYTELSQDMTKIFYGGFRKKEIDEFEFFLSRIFDNLVEYAKN
jgi:DNA-binding MarR family transcriptional regulator